jgi:hypothetical protein
VRHDAHRGTAPRSRAVEAAPLPDALAAAQAVEPIAYALYVDNVLRLALSPEEVAPLLGLSAWQCARCAATE